MDKELANNIRTALCGANLLKGQDPDYKQAIIAVCRYASTVGAEQLREDLANVKIMIDDMDGLQRSIVEVLTV